MKISDETKVGILAAVGITVLILGYSFLKGKNLFVKQNYYYALYNKVDGLNPSDPVTLNGFRVGKVANLQLMGDNSGRVIAKIMMEQDVPVPKNSIAKIISSDLLGEKAIQLIRGRSEELAQDGDTIIGDIAATLQEGVSEQLLPVKIKAENLMGSLDSVITIVQTILAAGKIESAIVNLDKAMAQFAQVAIDVDTLVLRESEKIGRLLTNVENFTANLDSNGENITRLLTNLATITDSISSGDLVTLIENLKTTFAELTITLNKLNSSEGSLGLLLNDSTLYTNLEKVTNNLDLLLIDVKQNPKRYVQFSLFGGKDKASTSADQQTPEGNINK